MHVANQEQNLRLLKKKHVEHSIEPEKEVEFPPLELQLSDLVGIWKLSEIRMAPDKTGTPPVTFGNDILMQITDDGLLAIATEGPEELADNIEGIPTEIRIEENFLCADDDIVFKIQFKANCTEVLLVNDAELLFKIDIGEGQHMYKYFTKTH